MRSKDKQEKRFDAVLQAGEEAARKRRSRRPAMPDFFKSHVQQNKYTIMVMFRQSLKSGSATTRARFWLLR